MREATQRCLRALAALIVLGGAAANAPAQNLTTYDCEWKWKHDSQVGWSCTYETVHAIPLYGMPGRCMFSGVQCWDFVSDHVDNTGDGGAIILTLDEIAQARNCGGILTPGGDCSVPEPTE